MSNWFDGKETGFSSSQPPSIVRRVGKEAMNLSRRQKEKFNSNFGRPAQSGEEQ